MKKLQNNLVKMGELVTELERAKVAKTKVYHLVAAGDRRYYLMRLSDNKMVSDGYMSRIKSFCNLRNISSDDILDAELIF